MKNFNLSLYSLLIQHFIENETIQTMEAGTILFQEKEYVNHVYLLLSGKVALGRMNINGKEFILKLLNDEEIIMEYQIFKHAPKYHFFAKTITNCEVLVIKREHFEAFFLQDQERLSSLTAWLSTRYLKAQMKCQDLIIHGKKGGLYSILIRLCASFGIKTANGIVIDVPLTHQELANLTFGTREVVQRMLKELKEKDVISYDKQKIIIKNLNYLKKEVDCQNCSFEICGIN
ncbi:CRP/FNR family transcriptional regulator [Cytobacillus eiseniae]|uniref:CRP/FNR family transcriptional regulator n=1 Tax=Cytobacillus eiseniae TaxID=762947 RepID=A0ABS4RH36_9BACI|nr:Crp/Fnr family transcriptional regulator [Cytobacillus eiseniae]MBP2241634.1 CRP/FNR family transcriptional regulator [Cytobacillus eiseniae]